ncbi:hypothetical protein GCM10010123_14530 [Pilimelia anulata]|uniref:SCP domain-containing protein n=1 Tax=Pilimelia anulata TaxID=53371 RepID=A0A8J3B123_9ACTN|nr:CAP domain-containing protein [Pilimelia anulata]GGJ86010.1 hypothetical protein GCM10010123_14530 [Pilimelia anulata]
MTALRRIIVPVLLAIVGAGLLTAPASPAAAVTVAAARAAKAKTERASALRYLNAYRVRSGCRPVRALNTLNLAAQRHAADMATRGYFNHVSPRTGTFVQRARRAGYRAPMSENIAWGQPNGRSAFLAWRNSPPHRRNMVNCAARSVGTGMAYSRTGTPYWVQVFGRV